MPPYQQRLIDEKKHLDEKIAKLKEFLWDEDRREAATCAELDWMRTQLTHMDAYSYSLEARISLWNVA